MPETNEKIAVVTGAAGGMGQACARHLAREHHLVLADVSEERVEAVAASLRTEGANALALPCDVSDPTAVRRLADHTAEAGGLSTLVHTAGVSANMGFSGHRIIEINLLGTIHVLDAFLDTIRNGAAAVCIGSIGGYRPTFWEGYEDLFSNPLSPDFFSRLTARVELDSRPRLAYAFAKRGVILECERRAHQWGRRGARLISVSPGMIVDTPMGQLEAAHGAAALIDVAAIPRGGTAEDVAQAVEFLTSDRASYITGCDLRVDGGAIAGLTFHASDDAKSAWRSPPDERD
jgi:NAD(P)-dependent dehydrogenase (short-subunit alcohol dehydrogenase family)